MSVVTARIIAHIEVGGLNFAAKVEQRKLRAAGVSSEVAYRMATTLIQTAIKHQVSIIRRQAEELGRRIIETSK